MCHGCSMVQGGAFSGGLLTARGIMSGRDSIMVAWSAPPSPNDGPDLGVDRDDIQVAVSSQARPGPLWALAGGPECETSAHRRNRLAQIHLSVSPARQWLRRDFARGPSFTSCLGNHTNGGPPW